VCTQSQPKAPPGLRWLGNFIPSRKEEHDENPQRTLILAGTLAGIPAHVVSRYFEVFMALFGFSSWKEKKNTKTSLEDIFRYRF
jgi:hypothetical protein